MNLHLTKKGEAYAARQSGNAYHARAAIEAEVERLIALLDALDGDPDLEPTLGAPEIPPLRLVPGGRYGWHTVPGTQEHWGASGDVDDREEDEDREQDILDQPHDADLDLHEGEEWQDFEPAGAFIPGGGSVA